MEVVKKASKPNITIDPDLQEKAKAAAKADGLSYSAWVRLAIRRQLAKEKCEAGE